MAVSSPSRTDESRQPWVMPSVRATTLAASAAAPGALIALGVALRAVRFAVHRPLWLDEAALALNLMSRSYSHLFGALDFKQGAPAGYLMLEKLSLNALGDSEQALRLPAFLAGLVAVPLFWKVASRYLPRTGALLALALFALIEPLIYYSAELKQYSFDVLAALVLAVLFDRAFERATPGRVAGLGVAATVAPWFSHPSVFVIAGGGCVLLAVLVRERNWRTLAVAAAAAAAALAAFLAAYFTTVAHLGAVHNAAVGAAGAGSHSVARNLIVIFSDPGGLPHPMIALTALLAAAGIVVLARRAPLRLAFIVATTAIAAIAGLSHQYPLGKRWELFLLPFAILLLSAGTTALVNVRPLPIRLLAAAAGAAVLIAPAVTSAQHIRRVPANEAADALLAHVYRDWLPGDTLYVSSSSQYAVRYYLTCHDCNSLASRERARWPFRTTKGPLLSSPALVPTTRTLVIGRARFLPEYLRDFRAFDGRRRVWLLFSHTAPVRHKSILRELDTVGTRLLQRSKGTAVVWLYDFAAPPGAKTSG
jgi:hypothetical protein